MARSQKKTNLRKKIVRFLHLISENKRWKYSSMIKDLCSFIARLAKSSYGWSPLFLYQLPDGYGWSACRLLKKLSLKETMLPSWQNQQFLSLSDLLHPTSERGLGPRLGLWIWASAFSSLLLLGWALDSGKCPFSPFHFWVGFGFGWVLFSPFHFWVLFRLWTLVLTCCSPLSILVWCFLMKAKWKH